MSGGGDSTALLHLLAGLAREEDRPLHALIVDHRLRSESAAEAHRTAEAAEALGARARILAWDTPRRSQKAARLARHRLLAAACREIGADRLFLGHTREDRIETLAMRLARPAGGRALAAMGYLDPSPAWPQGRGVILARPLLDARREDLRVFLKARGADWIEDPSNIDTRYERVRLRMAGVAGEPGFAGDLLRLGAAARAFEDEVRAAAVRLLGQAARPLGWGGLQLDPRALAAGPGLVSRRAMEMAMLAVSGEPDLPGPGRVRILIAALKAGASRTAAGAMLDEKARLGRDPGAAAGRADKTPGAAPLDLAPGESGVFDARFEVSARSALTVKAAGREGAHLFPDVPAAFRPGLPVFLAPSGEPLAPDTPEAARHGTLRALTAARMRHLAFPFADRSWFDEA